jgi:hypothetical protein
MEPGRKLILENVTNEDDGRRVRVRLLERSSAIEGASSETIRCHGVNSVDALAQIAQVLA